MKRWLFLTLASVLTFLATFSSVFACVFAHYQPELPKSLQK
ncbi:cyclic lactone autoinducer peptide [Candidatus Formimonas warabiya]|nr:cyclic lactone autoinducer peptide [Candidatus Formimonas warabiya]